MTSALIKQIDPRAKISQLNLFIEHIAETMVHYEINTIQRKAAFIANLAHESAHFNRVNEYGTGEQYEGRKDLGNIYPGDGKRFEGRGLIQITGRINYKACSLALLSDLSLLTYPQLLEMPRMAALSAGWFWNTKGINVICDKPADWTITLKNKRTIAGKNTFTKLEWITVKINGGLNGHAERITLYNNAIKALAA